MSKSNATKRNYNKHGMTDHYLHNAWKAIKQRCLNPNTKHFNHYGGRGIIICDRWITSFDNFCSDVGERPSAKHSIDRIDNNGNYEPNNIKWSTQSEQNFNKTTTHRIEYNGLSMAISEWADYLGIRRNTLICRIDVYNWSITRAFTEPVAKRNFSRSRKSRDV